MAKLLTFWDYTFSRENKPFKLLFQGPLAKWEFIRSRINQLVLMECHVRVFKNDPQMEVPSHLKRYPLSD